MSKIESGWQDAVLGLRVAIDETHRVAESLEQMNDAAFTGGVAFMGEGAMLVLAELERTASELAATVGNLRKMITKRQRRIAANQN